MTFLFDNKTDNHPHQEEHFRSQEGARVRAVFTYFSIIACVPVDHAERLWEETRRVTGVFAPLPFERGRYSGFHIVGYYFICSSLH